MQVSTRTPPLKPPAGLRAALEPLIERHGLWHVLRAVFAARREIRRRRVLTLRGGGEVSAHIRRDIGLPPEAPPPRSWMDR
ncbi:hypothetical protein [Celeribacter indicus]|nr:hypothetical protein [Celeribacter indicus]SDW78530.1 hypothetical protein SAMN05443573_10752 [Celeribacter indicus]